MQKFISSLLLIAVVSTPVLGTLAVPGEAKAFALGDILGGASPSVPVEGAGGFLDHISVQPSLLGESIYGSIINAGVNQSLQSLSSAFADNLDKKTKITDTGAYTDALVNSKGIASELQRRYGADALPKSALGDVNGIVGIFENLGLNKNLTPEQAARLGVGRGMSRADHEKQVRQLIVGATALLTQTFSCGQVNTAALTNTAKYLAAASAGVVASDIKASSGIDFYKNLGRLGSPLSTPAFWVLSLQDNAIQTQSAARESASLEILSPGLKSPQTVNQQTGLREIGSSQNLIKSSQDKAIGSLFTSAGAGALSRIPTNSFSAFISYVGKLYLQGYILLGAKTLGSILGLPIGNIIGKIVGNLGADASWILAAQSYGQFVAEQITKAFVTSMFNRLIGLVFQGTILGESSGCRQPARFTALTSGINTNQITQQALAGLIFNAIPASIQQGESSTLTWDVSSFGSAGQVTVSLTGFGNVEVSGTRTVTPATTTTYTLTVTKAGQAPQQLTQTVTVQPAAAADNVTVSDVSFSPNAVTLGGTYLATITGTNITDATTFDAVYTYNNGAEVNVGGWQAGAVGTHTVTPDYPLGTYTIKRLIVGGQTVWSGSVSLTVGAGAGNPDFAKVQFSVLPQTLAAAGNVTVTWDASAISGAQVFIVPLSQNKLATTGSQIMSVLNTVVLTLIVTDATGEMIGSRGITVTVAGEALPRQ